MCKFQLFSYFHAKVYVYKNSQLLALYYVFSKLFHIEYLKNTQPQLKLFTPTCFSHHMTIIREFFF